jgi:hypothetical protein
MTLDPALVLVLVVGCDRLCRILPGSKRRYQSNGETGKVSPGDLLRRVRRLLEHPSGAIELNAALGMNGIDTYGHTVTLAIFVKVE